MIRGMILMLAAGLLLNTPGALAKERGGDGRPPGFQKGEKRGWKGEVPPGWERGKKKGWRKKARAHHHHRKAKKEKGETMPSVFPQPAAEQVQN